MDKTIKDMFILTLLTLIVTTLLWLPHFLVLPNFWGLSFKEGFSTIYRNFDGLEYIVIAKSFYNPVLIASIPQSQPAIYYASHFPGYSILIALLAPFVGFLKSMLIVSLSSTIFSVWAFYLFIKKLKLTSKPLFLSFIFLILPARWLIVHSVGSSESLFIFLVISCLYFFVRFEQTQHLSDIIISAVFGLAAQITRPPGILLFISLMLYVLRFKKIQLKLLKFFPLILIPLGLLGVFYLYKINYADFWAYFHSGDNIHLTFPPFQVFNKNQFWVGEAWLEDIILLFILSLLGGMLLWTKRLYALAFFVFTYLTAASFVAHRDISRYILPVAPFVLIAFEKVLTSKEFKIILPIILLAIYLYAQNFLLNNTAPVANLQLFN